VKYGCLPMKTKVLTKKGWKYFDEIVVGDECFGFKLGEI
jgi:hypothetical protein